MAGVDDTIYKTKYYRDKIYDLLVADANLIARNTKFAQKLPEFALNQFPIVLVNSQSDTLDRVTLGGTAGEDLRTFIVQVNYFTKSHVDDTAHDDIMDMGDEIIEAVKFMRDADYAMVPNVSHPIVDRAAASPPFIYGGEITIEIQNWYNRT